MYFKPLLLRVGWNPGDAVSSGHALQHNAYLQATTMTVASIGRLPDRNRSRRSYRLLL
jgi:hypothetical protein